MAGQSPGVGPEAGVRSMPHLTCRKVRPRPGAIICRSCFAPVGHRNVSFAGFVTSPKSGGTERHRIGTDRRVRASAEITIARKGTYTGSNRAIVLETPLDSGVRYIGGPGTAALPAPAPGPLSFGMSNDHPVRGAGDDEARPAAQGSAHEARPVATDPAAATDPIPTDDDLDIHGAPDATLGGYLREHNRPPAFEGADGEPYTVSPETEKTPDLRAPWEGYLVFPRWARTGLGVVGHVETGTLLRGRTQDAVLRELSRLPLIRVRELLDQAVTAQGENQAATAENDPSARGMGPPPPATAHPDPAAPRGPVASPNPSASPADPSPSPSAPSPTD